MSKPANEPADENRVGSAKPRVNTEYTLTIVKEYNIRSCFGCIYVRSYVFLIHKAK